MRPAVALQYALPHRFLSRLVYWATRWTWEPWKNFLIARVVRSYRVDMSQAQVEDPAAYATFNAFFPRPGNYRIWTQFQRGDVLTTVSFTVRAERLH